MTTNQTSQPKVYAVIVAAGSSQRMNGVDKVFTQFGGKPVLAWSVEVFQNCSAIDGIVLVVSRQNLARAQELAAEQKWSKVAHICIGGERRQDSVHNGLKCISSCDWVVIHDGARPFVSTGLIEEGLATARDTGAAAAAVPVTDTIKVTDDNQIVLETPPRYTLSAAQTPQIFRWDIIQAAYQKIKADMTDDASMVEILGYKVKLYLGSYDNIKITTARDLALAELMRQHDR